MARNNEQNQEIRETRKEKIRQAALQQFAKQGLFGTRIQDIAEAADIAQGLLYHYYPSKDAIFEDLIDDALNKINEASFLVRDMKCSARDKVLFSLRKIMETIEVSQAFSDTCRLLAQATNTTVISGNMQQLIEKKRDIPYQVIAEVMETGQREGSIISGDPKMLAVLFWTSINGLAIFYATNKDIRRVPDYRILASMFLVDEVIEEEDIII